MHYMFINYILFFYQDDNMQLDLSTCKKSRNLISRSSEKFRTYIGQLQISTRNFHKMLCKVKCHPQSIYVFVHFSEIFVGNQERHIKVELRKYAFIQFKDTNVNIDMQRQLTIEDCRKIFNKQNSINLLIRLT